VAELLTALPSAMVRLPVGALDIAEVGELMQAVLGKPVDDAVLARVVHRTGGNPFLVHRTR
jgi:hypothetical protein